MRFCIFFEYYTSLNVRERAGFLFKRSKKIYNKNSFYCQKWQVTSAVVTCNIAALLEEARVLHHHAAVQGDVQLLNRGRRIHLSYSIRIYCIVQWNR